MATISLCMIVKNEEAVLGRCLDSIKDVIDEIIIVDTGSTDKTMEIAKEYTDKVFSFEWINDFAAARNFAFEKATCDYIMWLDADDVIDDQSRSNFAALKESFPHDADVLMLPYNVAFDKDGNCTFHYFRERIVRRGMGYKWMEPVHEHISMFGNVKQIENIAVIHKPGVKVGRSTTRNLDIYLARIEAGEQLSSRGMYYFARELRTHNKTQEAIEQYRQFISLGEGWREDVITACGDLGDCYLKVEDEKRALAAYFESFVYDLPRAEICCKIAAYYRDKKDASKAIYWYRQAVEIPRPSGGWGFITEDAWGFIPHVELSVLYYRLGQRRQAVQHHKAAKELKPDAPCIINNEQYFSQVSGD